MEPSEIERLLQELRRRLLALDSVVVAFSGGVDSSLLAWVAHDTLGPDRALMVTAVSASLPRSEFEDCARLVSAWGWRWEAVETDELARPAYRANGADRCYHCKAELMDVLAPLATGASSTVVLGVNLDDLGEHRPGQQAALDAGAVFPLVQAGLTKSVVRAMARHLGLETWDKPAAACLASRLPYGTPVTLGTLTQVERAEDALRRLGFVQLRVRHYGDLARVELDLAVMPEAVDRRVEVVAAVRNAGYTYVTLDLEGFRSGNLNGALPIARSVAPTSAALPIARSVAPTSAALPTARSAAPPVPSEETPWFPPA